MERVSSRLIYARFNETVRGPQNRETSTGMMRWLCRHKIVIILESVSVATHLYLI